MKRATLAIWLLFSGMACLVCGGALFGTIIGEDGQVYVFIAGGVSLAAMFFFSFTTVKDLSNGKRSGN